MIESDIVFKNSEFALITDTCEVSKLVHRRKRPKVDSLFSSLFFPTRLSDEYDSAPSRKNSRPFLDVFVCIGELVYNNLELSG